MACRIQPLPSTDIRAAIALALVLVAACEPSGTAGGGEGDGGGADTSSDSDSDSDAECLEYPDGPYDWDLDEVVSRVEFSAIHGSSGALTALDMCDVYESAQDVKSFVFVIGSTTCPYCPARFTEIGEMDLAAHAAEKVAVYYDEQSQYASLSAQEVSEIADTYGWEGGWRISDTAAKTIFYGGYPDWLWQTTPNVFVLDAHTMKIVAAEKGDAPALLNVLAEVQEIDARYP